MIELRTAMAATVLGVVLAKLFAGIGCAAAVTRQRQPPDPPGLVCLEWLKRRQQLTLILDCRPEMVARPLTGLAGRIASNRP